MFWFGWIALDCWIELICFCVVSGFEYWANPQNPIEGYVHWVADGQQSHRMGAGAVLADQGEGGSGVGPRLIPEEPMVSDLRWRFVAKAREFVIDKT